MEDTKAARYQAIALHAADALSERDARQKTLHRLRVHLRRLQAYLQLLGEDRNAEIMADCVSRLSRLRTLHVLQRYLSKHGCAKSDVRQIRKRIRRLRKQLDRKHVYRKIQRRVDRHALPPIPTTPDWLAHRMAMLREKNAEALRALSAAAQAKPSRKKLHVLRLKIKAIRYQEEWALDQTYAKPRMVDALKQAQSVLGDYEELAEFRRLAKKLALKSRSKIEKDRRRARKQARAVPATLNAIIEGLIGGRLTLLRAAPGAKQAAKAG